MTYLKKNTRLMGLSMTALTLGLAAPLTAQAELEFNIGVFSDYVDHGESRSDNNAVVQGGMEYTLDTGLFLGVQMSTLAPGDGQEVAPFIGYGFDFGETAFELGYEYFYYSGLPGETYEGEIFVAAEHGPFYGEITYVTRAHDRDAEGDTVYHLGAGHEFLPDTAFHAEIGYDKPRKDDNATFWALGVTRSTQMGDISLTYASRNESDAQDLFVAGYSLSF
ncbi:hypothetical protein M911_08125 [Ectothiorhodospira haloalkaliphila]|uniref:Outer membrane protein beta-barrel domain-containing protein n=1 Tax=Ectothiorhodospira haloalkaliphila TaxID=421628 RepID=W8KUB1_9GAMM|nr:TorF family putative porin [Ectothiorhodospira haloalkaliphila]AHK79126.1 hypothetical protein M911_08125 [Ectothiorhodospira haloalkaliphila]